MTTKRSEFGSLAGRTAGGQSIEDLWLPVGIHVWVRDGAENAPGRFAGWRHGADGWWGRVVTVTDGQPAESLVRADLLTKA